MCGGVYCVCGNFLFVHVLKTVYILYIFLLEGFKQIFEGYIF